MNGIYIELIIFSLVREVSKIKIFVENESVIPKIRSENVQISNGRTNSFVLSKDSNKCEE